VKPSGPGALLEGIWLITLSTSSSVKGSSIPFNGHVAQVEALIYFGTIDFSSVSPSTGKKQDHRLTTSLLCIHVLFWEIYSHLNTNPRFLFIFAVCKLPQIKPLAVPELEWNALPLDQCIRCVLHFIFLWWKIVTASIVVDVPFLVANHTYTGFGFDETWLHYCWLSMQLDWKKSQNDTRLKML
jgi:hypothetical protein